MPPLPPLPISQAVPETRYSILFSEPDDCLPEPLPSLQTIENAPIIHKIFITRCIAFVGTSYAVKYGYEVEPLEAENMKFIRQNTTVRVPRVYAVYQSSSDDGKHKTYIIMEKIAGESLDKLWDGLDATQKMEIVQQLKESFASIRDLPSPGFFGSIDKSGLRNYLFTSNQTMPSIDKPFDTEESLVNSLLERGLAKDPERLQYKTAYYRHFLMKVFKGNNQSLFSHGYLKLEHIMLQPDGSIAILDWAKSGWYPVYWDYAIALCARRGWENDWYTHIDLFLDEYPTHFAWMSQLQMDRSY